MPFKVERKIRMRGTFELRSGAADKHVFANNGNFQRFTLNVRAVSPKMKPQLVSEEEVGAD